MPKRKKASETGGKRGAMSLALTPRVSFVANSWCDQTGWSKTRFVEALVEFWVKAPDSVQLAILGVVPKNRRREFQEDFEAFFKGSDGACPKSGAA